MRYFVTIAHRVDDILHVLGALRITTDTQEESACEGGARSAVGRGEVLLVADVVEEGGEGG